MKYYIYARKSSEGEDRQALSIESQIEHLSNLAKRRCMIISRVFRESKSAKDPGRKVFEEMMSCIKDGMADGIICWKLDRLARNPVDAGLVQWSLQKGVIKQIVTPDRDYLPEDNTLLQSVEFGMANQFILDHRKNVCRGMETKLSLGQFPDKPPVGYMNDPITRKIVIDPHNFSLVKQLFERALGRAHNGYQLCELANELGIRRRVRGQLVTSSLGRSQVYELLKNPFYMGNIIWKGQIYSGQHEPMITKTDHEELLRLFGKNQTTDAEHIASSRQKHSYKLNGLVRCSCGLTVIPWRIKNRQENGKRYLYYVCSSRFNPRYKDRCKPTPIRAEKFDSLIRKELESIALPPLFAEWLRGQAETIEAKERQKQEELIASMQTRMKTLETKRSKLLDLVLDSNLSPDDFKRKKEEIEAVLASLQEELGLIQAEKERSRGEITRAIDISSSVLDVYDRGTDQEVKELIKAVVEAICFADGRVKMEVRRPFKTIEGMRRA